MGRVTKCVCHDRSFEEIKEFAQKNGINSVDVLQARKICSCGCQMCAPYVELMLETGGTSFEPGAPYKRNKNSH